MTRFLTAQQLLFIHARLTAETGGEYGLLSLGLLESAVARPQATFDGFDLHLTLFDKAAALMESLVVNHPFVDGNKRVAITAAGLFLLRNGFQIVADNDQLERFTFQVVIDHPALAAITAWLEANSEAQR